MVKHPAGHDASTRTVFSESERDLVVMFPVKRTIRGYADDNSNGRIFDRS